MAARNATETTRIYRTNLSLARVGMLRLNVATMAALAFAFACMKPDASKTDTSHTTATAASAAVAAKVGESGGMKTPESVRYDPELDVFYVSNINGNPSDHDGNGFIAVVRADSTGAPA